MSAHDPSRGDWRGLWGPIDRHPRGAFLSLAATTLVLVTLLSLGGGLVGARLQSHVDRQAVESHRHHLHRAPAQFGGQLDPYGYRHGGAIRMSFVGASVTRGWYATSTEDAYPAVAARIIAGEQQHDVDWKVTALPGAGVARALTWSFPTDQDLVVIDLVTDDFLYGTPLSTYEVDYAALLQKLRRGSPRAGFVCLGDWGPIGAVDQHRETAYGFDQIVAATCHAFSGVYVPINQIFDVPGTRGPIGHPSIVGPARNDFHPNDYGHELIAEALVAGVNGDPPTEAVPTTPGLTVPAPLHVPTSAGTPSPISGHERPSPTPRASAQGRQAKPAAASSTPSTRDPAR